MSVAHIETGVLYCEDNLLQLTDFPDNCVDLIYLDPPFFSNRHYEVIWGDEAEVRSFEDRWDGGIHVYIAWMRERMMELHRVLRPNGQIYLHCDDHASHYLKVMMDDVFGYRHLLNEIIWHYETSGGAPTKTLIRNHDTIFRYAKGPKKDVTWNAPREPWPVATLKKWQTDEEGNIYRTQHKFKKRYYIDPNGKLMDDVWDITLSSRSKERLGYPTQKPIALLERIIAASSEKGDVVLDPFCGCGTTVAAAHNLGREWVGIDISQTAVRVIQQRFADAHVRDVKAIGLPQSVAELKALKPFEFQNWVIHKCHGVHAPRKSGDMGIDGFSFMTHDPIQVKQSEKVGRNVVDNFETAMQRAGRSKGYIVAFSYTSGARGEVARAKAALGLDIELVTVTELMNAERRSRLSLLPDTEEGLGGLQRRTGAAMPTMTELVASARQVS